MAERSVSPAAVRRSSSRLNPVRDRSAAEALSVAARVAACKAKAEALLADVNALIGELPKWRGEVDEEGQESVLMRVRAELEDAAGWIQPAIDYLSPRSDDDEPGCCAHRRLQALIATQEARS